MRHSHIHARPPHLVLTASPLADSQSRLRECALGVNLAPSHMAKCIRGYQHFLQEETGNL